MVRYIQAVFDGSLKYLGKWIFPIGIVTLIVLAVAALLAYLLYRTNREALTALTGETRKVLKKFLIWVFVIAVILLQVNLLKAVRQGVIQRIDQATAARYTAEGDSGAGETIQYVPSVSYNETTTRTQRLIIPKYTLNYINASGLENPNALNSMPGWSPDEVTYDTRPIVDVQDQLEKDQNAIVINRKITINRFLPMKLKSSDISLRLTFKDRGNKALRQYYEALFSGNYSFTNTFSDKKMVHFSFPLPYSSTLSNFKFKVDGKDCPVQDVTRGYEWNGELEPGKTVPVEVQYSHSGSKSWTYKLSSRREAISDFKLTVESNNPHIKFQRGSLSTDVRSKALGGATLTWNLSNIVTSQDISLYFSSVSKSEVITRLFIFGPVALLGLIVVLLGWAHVKKRSLTPLQIILISCAYSGGFALTAYLLTSLPLAAALIVSFALSLAIMMLVAGGFKDSAMLTPLLLWSAIPVAFNFVGSTGLLLCIAGFIMLAAFAFNIEGMTKLKRTESGPSITKPMVEGEGGE
ncbi:MAG: hypothetical protein AB2L14_15515 [Candidatus Xenobiia bacterium LiM19]